MKLQNRRIQLTVVFVVILLLLLLFNGEWGTSDKPYTGDGNVPSAEVIDSLADAQMEAESHTTVVPKEADTVVVQVETADEEAPDTDTTFLTKPNDTDSLQNLSTTSQDSVNIESERVALPYNLIEVRRRNDSLFYIINGVENINLVEGLTQLNMEKETLLKLSGNITYAEEQEVKTTLEVKEIAYKEAE